MNSFTEPNIKTIELKWRQLAATTPIHPNAITNAKFDVDQLIAEDLWYRVKLELLSYELDPYRINTGPSNWWEHFKQRWFPKWYLNKHPIKLSHVMLKREVVFPESSLDIQPPELGRAKPVPLSYIPVE